MTPFRAEVRAWLAANVPAAPLPRPDTAAGSAAHRRWERRLFDARLAAVCWPVEYGGRAAPAEHALEFDEEYHAAGAAVRIGQNGLFLLAPTLLAHGTPEQCARILPATARGDQVWAQAWSEPQAGSDLAAILATATRTGGGWLLSGQKTWSSRAAVADRAFGLFRSAAGARPHDGLTYLMFGLRAPGVTVRPIEQLDGANGFAEIFLDDVFVPDADVIGEPGDGWRIAMSTAGHERGLSLRGPGRFLAAAHRLMRLAGDEHRDRVADAWIGARAYQAQAYASLTGPVPPSAMKLFWSELDVTLHETALDVLGPYAEVDPEWTSGYLFALAGPIYAGTNEIQRDILATRVLGLPHDRGARRQPQPAFAAMLHDLLSETGTGVWKALAGVGVTGLLIPERFGGSGATPTDLITACEELGHHAVPGPLAESIAAVPELLAGTDLADTWLPDLAAGRIVATMAAPPLLPYATDGDSADLILYVTGDEIRLGRAGTVHASMDPARRLADVEPGEILATGAPVRRALELGTLACAAQLLGAGRAMLEMSVAHARTRTQFGRPIGSFQAVQHRLADVAVALDFARPLLHDAAAGLDERDVSAAKVACGEAALRAARAALQVHGAIGYTREHGLGRWLTRVRVLHQAWGTPSRHRRRILRETA